MIYLNEIDPYAAEWLRNLIREGLIPEGEVDERSIRDVRPSDLRGYTQCHFFAGIGGWPLAMQLAGVDPGRPLWTGSCPCQPFSTAGKGTGVNDDRHLWPDFFRLIRECGPARVFGEQVASKLGLGWLDGVCRDLEDAGYAVGAADLCAPGVGAAHIRQRLFWVANASDTKRGWWPESDGECGGAFHASDRCGPSGLANAGQHIGGATGDAELQADAAERSQVAEKHQRRGQDGGMADASSRGEMPAEQSGRLYGAEQGGSRLGHTERDGLRVGRRATANGVVESSDGPIFGWSDYYLIPCRDGKTRRVGAGVSPLANGVPYRLGPMLAVLVGMGIHPKRAKRIVRNYRGRLAKAGRNRVGRLRGYGNAIVPQLAAKFIKACL